MPSPTASESPAHRELKRLGLIWAQAHGYRVAALEVSVPDRGVRLDLAACRLVRGQPTPTTAIFECKAFATDFRRDARSIQATLDRLATLRERTTRIEQELHVHYPSIRNGDSLFQEFETLNFERPGYERYQKVIAETRSLSARLHRNTKFDRLVKYGCANLYYLIVEPGILRPSELPAGWGLLERTATSLDLHTRPLWHEVSEASRQAFFQRVALAATRAVNREAGVTFEEIQGTPRV